MGFGLHNCCWFFGFSFRWRDSGGLWLLGFFLHSCWVFGFSCRWRASARYHCSSIAKGKSKDRTREKGVQNLWRNVGLLLGEGERRKRKRESLVLLTWHWHVPNTGPIKMHVFTIMPPLLVFHHLKISKSCFQFPYLNSIFWELS